MKLVKLVLGIGIILGSTFALGQSEPNLETGFTPYGSYHGTDIDTVSLLSGNVTLHIPYPYSFPQRGGGHLNNNYFTVTNAKTWVPKVITLPDGPSQVTGTFWTAGNSGLVNILLGGSSGETLIPNLTRQVNSTTVSGVTSVAVSNVAVRTWDGATHYMYDVSGNGTAYEAADASGWHANLTNPDANGTPQAGVMIGRDGTQYTIIGFQNGCTPSPLFSLPPAQGNDGVNKYSPILPTVIGDIQRCSETSILSTVTDANGNVLSRPIFDPNTGLSTGTDSMGRSVSFFGLPPGVAFSSTTDSSGCSQTLPFLGANIINYPGPNGTTNQLKTCFGTNTIQTNFGLTGIVECPSAECQGTPTPYITTILLSDGSSWTLNYDSYGNVTFIGLPLGGSITYQWANVAFPSVGGGAPMSRAVTQRTITDNRGNSYVWKYQWLLTQSNPTSNNGTYSNVVTDPLNNDSVHVFTNLQGAFFETRTQFYQGLYSAGQLVKQIDTTYQVSPPTSFSTSGLPTNIQTTIFPSGKVSAIQKSYDASLVIPPSSICTSCGPGGTTSYGKVVTEKEYDWGPGGVGSGPGLLLRETDTTYKWQVNGDYLTAHFLDLPASVVVKDGAGCALSATDYAYDEPGYLTTPTPAVTTQHVSPPAGVRGNLTTVTKWLAPAGLCNPRGGNAISSHTKWYDTGEAYQQIDPLNSATTHTYDPAYVGAFPTQTCNAVGCVSATYDFTTGLLTSFTNINATKQASANTPGDAAHTSFYVYDQMSRLTSATFPPDPDPTNGGAQAKTTLTYPFPITLPFTVTKTRSIASGLTDSVTSTFDGLGRVYKTQHPLIGGTAEVDTTYDGLDHVISVTNPYFSTSDATYGTIQSQYDALGRVTQITEQDGSIKTVAYNIIPNQSAPGDCTQSADEANKQRMGCTDALGRLIEVHEPGDTFSGTPGTGKFTISGTLASQSGVGEVGATYATAQVTITGDDQDDSTPGHQECIHGNCFFIPAVNVYDSGTITLSISGTGYSASFASTTDSAPSNLAQVIVSAMANDPNVIVTNVSSGTNASGIEYTAISLQARNSGTSGNSITVSTSYTYNSTLFSSPSFVTGSSSGTLAGGTASNPGATVYDKGNVSATVSGFTANVPYSQTENSTADQVASALAAALSVSSSPVTATSSGTQLIVAYNNVGTSGDTSISVTSQSTQTQWTFPANAFTGSGTLSNGFNPEGISLDFNYFVTQYSYDGLGDLLQVTQKGDPSISDSSQWRVRNFTYDTLGRLLTATNPESGTISYSYDADSELLQKTSPAPNQTGTATQTVSYCYDALHRVTGKGYGAQNCPLSTPVVSYTYDSGPNAKGKLVSLTDQAGTGSYGYDILGRLTTETRTLTGANNAAIPKNLAYSYNLDSSLKTLTYPSGATVTYTPDSAGRMLSAVDSTNGINYATSATYGPDSALTGFVSGYSGTFAGITSAFSYNKRLQPVNMSATAPSQTVYSIGYDFHVGNGITGADNGNVFGITNYKDTTHGRDQTFTYDSLNRLTSAQNAGTDCTAMVLQNKTEYWGNTYSYDAWGNVLQKTITKCGAEHLSVTADAHNWIHATASPDYQYDAAGNMTYDATASLNYSFDQENRLTGADGYTYTYDGDGNRVRKSNGNLAANGTLYWAMTPGVVAETDLAGTLKSEYVFFDGERVARKDFPSNAIAYYFSDNLKTASVITDAAGNIAAESDYYPWGGELQFVNNDSNHYKFTGKERDETGLDYFGARYYSNGLGRWVSADWSATPVPIPYANFSDPQTINLYSYVRGLPTSGVDTDGHDALRIVDKQTGEVTIVIPVHYTGREATPENISKITHIDNNLDTGGSTVKIQVISTDKPINGVLNQMDLSPGAETKKYGPPGEGVNKVGGDTGHINTDNSQSNEAAAHDTLHFAGVKDQYNEEKPDSNGNRTSTPKEGYDDSNIMTSRSGTKLKPEQIHEAEKNKSTKQCTTDKGKTTCK